MFDLTPTDWIMPTTDLAFKPDWPTARQHHIDWWNADGMVLSLMPVRDQPLLDLPKPPVPDDLRTRWINPIYQSRVQEHHLATHWPAADTVPLAQNCVGAGDLAALLGAAWDFAEHTVWFKTCIQEPENPNTDPDIVFDPNTESFKALKALLIEQVRHAQGRYLVSMPDLVENLDILAAMRDPNDLMMDLIERPNWVKERITQITQAYFQAFDQFFNIIKDTTGGNAFCAFDIYGPGKTAKVQCDASAMISPDMYEQFVLPALIQQCDWLDYALYHLDGTDAVCHLPHILSVPSLNGVQWTAGAGQPDGSDPQWHDMYRQILDAGKCLQVNIENHTTVIPLLDAIGSKGVFIRVFETLTQPQAEKFIEQVETYRD